MAYQRSGHYRDGRWVHPHMVERTSTGVVATATVDVDNLPTVDPFAEGRDVSIVRERMTKLLGDARQRFDSTKDIYAQPYSKQAFAVEMEFEQGRWRAVRDAVDLYDERFSEVNEVEDAGFEQFRSELVSEMSNARKLAAHARELAAQPYGPSQNLMLERARHDGRADGFSTVVMWMDTQR